MPYPSDPRLIVLHGLRLKGVAGRDVLARATGLADGEVAAILADLAAEGLAVEHRGSLAGWALTPLGRAEHGRLVGAEVDAAGARTTVAGAYGRFRALNGGALDACSRWHVREVAGHPVRNDHSDTAYDAGIVADLAALERRARPLCDDLAAALERYGRYGDELHHAVERVEAGDGDWFTRPLMPSFHTVWFELHEDLLTTLGLDRDAEAGTETETTSTGAS
jgi:hypothetical protein